jgi:hypothetical protein
VTLTLDRSASAPENQPAARKAASARTPSPGLTGWLTIGASASIAAGIIHAGAIASHSDHQAAVWVFVATTVVQLAWGTYALARPTRSIALGGVVIGAAALGGWVIAKRWGLWFIDGLNEKEPIQLADGLCALLAGVTMLTAAAALLIRRRALPRAAVALLSLAALLSASPGTVRALDHHHPGTVSAEPAPAVPPHPFDPDLPIDLGGVPGVTPQEQARAENLLADTLLRLPQWSDPAFDEAHGFFSIHDGRTGVEHYVNLTYMADDAMLDPDKPESLVFDTTVTPKRLVAAMYMATPEMTLAQVPDIGGALTQWHIHSNLCFNDQGHVTGLTQADGTCGGGLIKGAETPMIHVWIVAHKCGPFAALEGVGGGQVAPGQPVSCDHVHGS